MPSYGLLGDPNAGGLSASNRNNPYGLRARLLPDGTYEGQMMPKWTGWQGLLGNIAYPESISTELSTGDNLGEFPSITPDTSQEQLARLLSLKNDQPIPEDIYAQALKWAESRRKLHKNPFKDAEDK